MIKAKELEKQIKKYKTKDIIIYVHADHDGICTAVGLNYLFGNIETKFSLSFKPRKLPYFKNKKLFLICDLQLTKKQIIYLLNKGLEIINFDHHEILEVKHKNYLCLNPKKLYGKEFISSSGLIWKIFKPEKIAWILTIGSAADLCVEDNIELFEFVKQKHPELLQNTSLEAIYSSKIFELAQILLMSFENPENGFKIVMESIKEGPKRIFDSYLYKLYLEKQKDIQNFFEEKNKIIENKKFVLIDSSGMKFSGSYSVYLNLKNKDKRAYIEYNNGRLFFRNYFGDENIKDIAKLFNGSGSHKRSGGAYTRETFDEVLDILKNYFERKQCSLFDF